MENLHACISPSIKEEESSFESSRYQTPQLISTTITDPQQNNNKMINIIPFNNKQQQKSEFLMQKPLKYI